MLLFFSWALALEPSSDLPFWKAKPEIYRQVVEGRRVFISVSEEAGEKKKMKVNGGGQIQAPKDFSFKKIQEFDRVFRKNSYIRKVQSYPKRSYFFIFAKAYGFETALKIRWKIKENTDNLSVLSFEIIDGLLKGFEWELRLESAKRDHTDVGIVGQFVYEKFPMPSFFLKFGLEVIFQRMAIDIRSGVEEDLKHEHEPTKSK